MSGIEMANWNWKVVRQFVSKRFGIGLSRSACLNYLHRLGFVLKRPKKRLVKADEQKREAFVAEYATLSDEAWRTGAKIFFAGEAHFRADAELRGKWVLKGEPAPRFHEGRLWWTRPARAMAKRPATTRQCAWRPVRACPRENGGSHRKPVLGNQGPGKGEGREFPLRAVHPERRGQGPLPHRPAIKGRRLSARIPAQSPMYCKCTSHLGFGLVGNPSGSGSW